MARRSPASPARKEGEGSDMDPRLCTQPRATTDSSRKRADPTKLKQRASVTQRLERDALAEQARVLETQLDELRRRAGLPTRADWTAIDARRAATRELDERTHEAERYITRVHSMVTNQLLFPPVNTLATFIHLPRDMAQRRQILRSMQELKLRRGIEVATSWLHHVDPSVPFLSEDFFTTETGEYHYYRMEIDQYPNFQTARQFYNYFVEFRYSIEISITDMLGQLTLREDTEDMDVEPTVWNHRFVTLNEDVGVPEELNFVSFAKFYSHSPFTNSPMGIIVLDTVNVDDQYPYLPAERTCKDIQSVHMVYEVRRPETNDTVVVFKQIRFGVQLPPRFDVEPIVWEKLKENFPKWPNFIAKHLHEYVVQDRAATRPSLATDNT